MSVAVSEGHFEPLLARLTRCIEQAWFVHQGRALSSSRHGEAHVPLGPLAGEERRALQERVARVDGVVGAALPVPEVGIIEVHGCPAVVPTGDPELHTERRSGSGGGAFSRTLLRTQDLDREGAPVPRGARYVFAPGPPVASERTLRDEEERRCTGNPWAEPPRALRLASMGRAGTWVVQGGPFLAQVVAHRPREGRRSPRTALCNPRNQCPSRAALRRQARPRTSSTSASASALGAAART